MTSPPVLATPVAAGVLAALGAWVATSSVRDAVLVGLVGGGAGAAAQRWSRGRPSWQRRGGGGGLAGVLFALGVLLLGYAVLRPVVPVQNADGAFCGSAWRSSQRDLSRGGERTEQQIEDDLTACEIPGDAAMRRAAGAGLAGLVVLALTAVVVQRMPTPERRVR